jgi:hypothetical protein
MRTVSVKLADGGTQTRVSHVEKDPIDSDRGEYAAYMHAYFVHHIVSLCDSRT